MPLSAAYLHPQFAILVYLIAVACAGLLLARGARLETAGRYPAIDGLRGLLAIGVFTCHAAVWYHYTATGIWVNSPSALYRHLGEASVVMFFMITGFLFWGKILGAKDNKFDWRSLYIGRIKRIMPLFLFALTLMLAIAFFSTGFVLQVPTSWLAWQIGRWASFTLTGLPSVNGFHETVPLLGVVWTLRYEWLFYLALPLLAGLVGKSVPVRWTLFSTFFVTLWFSLIFKLEAELLAGFLVGMTGAYWTRSSRLCEWGRHGLAALAGCIALYTAARVFPDTAYAIAPTLILAIPFLAVVSGNTFFGLLVWRPVRLLGQISYSIYLLHLFLLYVVFAWGVRAHAHLPLTVEIHWSLVLGLVPALIGGCYLSWRFIEAPFMRKRQIHQDNAVGTTAPTYDSFGISSLQRD